jgi:hypothetical protein
VDAVNERAFHDSIVVLAPGAGWPAFDGVVGTHQGRSSSSLVSVAKLVDFERGQVSCADFIGIIVLPRR